MYQIMLFLYRASPFRSQFKELLLSGCGIVDVGGAGMTHLSCGSVVIIYLINLKPRENRFKIPRIQYTYSKFYYHTIGTLFVFIGWIGVSYTTTFSLIHSYEKSNNSILNIFIVLFVTYIIGHFISYLSKSKMYFNTIDCYIMHTM